MGRNILDASDYHSPQKRNIVAHLLIIFSSRVRWSSRCLFLTGAAVTTGSATVTSISDFTCQSRGAMIVVAAFSEERSRTAVITILLGTPMLMRVYEVVGREHVEHFRETSLRVGTIQTEPIAA